MPSPSQIKSPYAFVQFYARFSPHAVAVVTQSGESTYRQLAQHIDRTSRHLQQAGVRSGQRVAVHVLAPYIKRLVVMALSRIGAVGVTLSDRAAELPLVKPEVVVTDQPGSVQGVPTIEVRPDWAGEGADALPPVEDRLHDEGAPLHIMLSSGTTGRPKMAVITYGDLRARMRTTARAYGLNASARMLVGMGANTIAGLIVPITAWANGAAVVIPSPSQTPAQALRMNPNVVALSPSHLRSFVRMLPEGSLPARGLSVYVAGAELPRKLSRSARLRLTSDLFTLYGSTEAGTVAIAHASEADSRPGFTGYVVPPAQVEIVDANGQPVPPGTPGEVRIRSDGMIGRYLDDDDASDSPLRGGWFYPGDAGVLDADMGLSILGRTVELINMGGVKISPHVVDELVAGLPGVKDVATCAVEMPMGVVPCIAVVADDGFDAALVHSACAEKIPQLRRAHVVKVAAIPRNDMGKILRRQLAESLRPAIAAP